MRTLESENIYTTSEDTSSLSQDFTYTQEWVLRELKSVLERSRQYHLVLVFNEGAVTPYSTWQPWESPLPV